MGQLLTTGIVVYFGIVLYDMLAQGSSPAAALVWPLQSLSKAFAWLSKVDPNAATKNDLTNISQQLASYQQQSQAQITSLQSALNLLSGGKIPAPPAPSPTPAPTTPTT
ncbi:MAG TPA: hypothetical protein VGP76_17820 [Planctomycetaceae bacterium]|jgi:hypothetical protein|nr:hypothetical protein [Planctomycetaceae bacterium]